MKDFEIVFESHSDGCVAYPLGIRGVVASEEDTFEESLADVKMAFAFHLQTFGLEVIESDCPVLVHHCGRIYERDRYRILEFGEPI